MNSHTNPTFHDYLAELSRVEPVGLKPLDKNRIVEAAVNGLCWAQRRSSQWIQIVRRPDFRVDDPSPDGLRKVLMVDPFCFDIYGLAAEAEWEATAEKEVAFLNQLWRVGAVQYLLRFES